MKKLKPFLECLWQLLPEAGLASEYHPAIEGGAIPIPFIQAQKLLLTALQPSVPNSNPLLDKPKRSFTSYMQGYSSIPLRDRAMIALRSAHLCQARHLLPEISLCAIDTGMKDSDIRMISDGNQAPGWNRHERLLLIATDCLHHQQVIAPGIWNQLRKRYSSQQMLDLVLCVASFHLCTYPF